MYKFVVTLIILDLSWLSDGTTSYDQRQTGDLNVQIALKNVQLIALLNGGHEEYMDYDYAYDYSEMTIKPQNGTTPKPLNVTITQSNGISPSTALANNTTESSVTNAVTGINVTEIDIDALGSSINATDSINNATESSINNVTNHITEPGINIVTESPLVDLIAANYSSSSTTSKNVINVSTTISPGTVNEENRTTTLATNHCRRGFVQNKQGKCEYKVHGTNALRRIIKLAQKIKIGRGLTET